MKRPLRLFLLIIVCSLIHCVLFGQDSLNKIYQVKFSAFKTHLSKEAKATLNDIAQTIKDQPGHRYAISSCTGTENQRLNQVTWDRVNKIVSHLVEKPGINADRLIFKYGAEGKDCNTIDITFTEDTIATDSPPHPNLRKKLIGNLSFASTLQVTLNTASLTNYDSSGNIPNPTGGSCTSFLSTFLFISRSELLKKTMN